MALGGWLRARGYSRAFVEDHLLPMVGAVWSSSRAGVEDFPARFLARFFDNHGLLTVNDRPTWLTVRGGSRTYVKALLEAFPGELRTGCPVASIRREDGSVLVRPRGARAERFDHVILACHADQALALLADPSPLERETLSRLPLPRQRRPPPPRRGGHAAASPRLVLLELPPRRRGRGRGLGHLLDEPAAAPGRRAAVLRDPQPSRRGPPGARDPPPPLPPPGLQRRRGGRPGAPRRPSSITGAPPTAAPTGATASTRTAWRAPSASASDSAWRGWRRRHDRRERHLPRHPGPRPPRAASPRLQLRRLAPLPRPRRAPGAAGRARAPAGRALRAPLLPPRGLPGRPGRPGRGGARAGRGGARRPPRRAGPAPHPGAVARPRLQPGELLLLLRRRRPDAPGGGGRGHQHAVGRAARLRGPPPARTAWRPP